MKRRTVGLIAILALGMLTPLTADSQAPAKVSRIGILAAGSFTPERARYLGVFRERLRDLGWIEDRDFTMEIRWAEGRVERLPELTSELVRLQVDMIVTLGGRDPSRATVHQHDPHRHVGDG
jgi:putative tryptophan/tyrosine transport system substrate-binding protein